MKRILCLLFIGAVVSGCKRSSESEVRVAETIASSPDDLLGMLAGWQAEPMTYDSLKILITSKSLRSIDSVLAALPKWLQASYTMVYNSADGGEATSYAQPRVLLFAPDAKFILTYNVNPKIHQIRVAQFADGTDRLHLHQIDFDAAGAAAAKFSEDDPDCSGCHNSDAKYHIEEYDHWEGWYGSRDDSFRDGSLEDVGLQKLRASAKDDGRLKNLDFPKDFPNYPYHRYDQAAGKNSLGRGFSSMPNTRLTTAMMRLEGRIVHRMLAAHKNYDILAPLLAYVMLEPAGDVIQFRRDVQETCQTALGDDPLDLNAALNTVQAGASVPAGTGRYQTIALVFKAGRVEVDDYLNLGSMIHTLREQKPPPTNKIWMDGFFASRDVVLDQVWRDLAKSDAALAGYYQPISMSDGIEFAIRHWGDEARYQRDYHFRPPQRKIFDDISTVMISPKGEAAAFPKVCALLRDKIRAKLNGRSANDGSDTPFTRELSPSPSASDGASPSEPL